MSGGPKLTGVDHVGVIVDDLEQACALLRRFGLEEAARVERPDLSAVFFDCGGTSIELIEVTDEDARAHRLGDRPAAIEHIAFAVDDVDETLEALAAIGVSPSAPPRLARGARTFWTDPATSDDVIFQFVEPPRGAGASGAEAGTSSP